MQRELEVELISIKMKLPGDVCIGHKAVFRTCVCCALELDTVRFFDRNICEKRYLAMLQDGCDG